MWMMSHVLRAARPVLNRLLTTCSLQPDTEAEIFDHPLIVEVLLGEV
jgi:hypothetical protein